MASSSTASAKRLDGIDLLRGLAVLLVLLNHVNMRLRIAKIPYAAGLPEQLVSSLVRNGQRGVEIFFAVSGFLITSVTLRRWLPLSSIRVRDFYRLRFARIAPLLLALLAVLSALHFAHVPNFVVKEKTGGLANALFAAFTFHINVLEAQRGYLPANWDILWSLSVEEVFYFFFPLLCCLLGRGKALIGVLLLFVILGPFSRSLWSAGNEVWHEYSYLGGMDAIALGCLTALLVSATQFSKRTLWLLGALGAATLLFTLCFSLRLSALEKVGLDMTPLAVGTSLLIAVAAQTQWKSLRLVRPLLLLGQCSYEIYLTHMFIVFALFDFFMSHGKPMGAVPILFVGTILLATLCGKAVARFYSEPLNRLLRQSSTLK